MTLSTGPAWSDIIDLCCTGWDHAYLTVLLQQCETLLIGSACAMRICWIAQRRDVDDVQTDGLVREPAVEMQFHCGASSTIFSLVSARTASCPSQSSSALATTFQLIASLNRRLLQLAFITLRMIHPNLNDERPMSLNLSPVRTSIS